MTSSKRILVTGGTGKTGRRIVERLQAYDVDVRVGSRSAEIPFDWNDQSTWRAALSGIDAVYIAYQPDLAVPGAVETIKAFTKQAVQSGVSHLVLLSGRGEEEAQRCEQIVQEARINWTILRASWFNQNFSEAFLIESVLSGAVFLPIGEVREPFIDADDIADVAVATLTEDSHTGKLYELTGPRLMTFADAISEIASASGRSISYTQIPAEDYFKAMKEENIPEEVIWLVNYLFTNVLDGRNECITNGVEQALGRPARDFSDYARETAATGVWNV